jgi:hypothetical protein
MVRNAASFPDLYPLKKGVGFSADHFRASEAEYASEWSIVYETLRKLCRRYPNHMSRDAVAAKVWIIGRTYATQIERGVKSLGGQGSALDQVATAIHRKCRTLDDLISRIPDHREAVLDDAVVAACIHAHGGLSEILRPITTGRTPRSFVSKYLHFHRPIIPIYDSVATNALSKILRWQSEFDCPSLGGREDPTYRQFVLHMRQLNGLAIRSGLKPSVRALDCYLMYEGERFRTGRS